MSGLPIPLAWLPAAAAAAAGVATASDSGDALLALVIVAVIGLSAWSLAARAAVRSAYRPANDNPPLDVAHRGWTPVADPERVRAILHR